MTKIFLNADGVAKVTIGRAKSERMKHPVSFLLNGIDPQLLLFYHCIKSILY